MERVFEAINGVFSFIGPLSDFLWDFPTNFDWYSSIPILGNISFAIILLLGSGIFFSFRIGFMQVTYFKKGIRTMTEKRVVETGISPLASFFFPRRDSYGKTRQCYFEPLPIFTGGRNSVDDRTTILFI